MISTLNKYSTKFEFKSLPKSRFEFIERSLKHINTNHKDIDETEQILLNDDIEDDF